MSSIFDLLNTAQNSIESQRVAMDVAAENVANALTPGYKARKVAFSARSSEGSFSDMLAEMATGEGLSIPIGEDLGEGTKVSAIFEDQTEGTRVYNPSHPMADEEGYIEMSNVDNMNEMMSMMNAVRQIKANLAVVEMAKKMAQEAINMSKNA